jgi:hypothetical protein
VGGQSKSDEGTWIYTRLVSAVDLFNIHNLGFILSAQAQ